MAESQLRTGRVSQSATTRRRGEQGQDKDEQAKAPAYFSFSTDKSDGERERGKEGKRKVGTTRRPPRLDKAQFFLQEQSAQTWKQKKGKRGRKGYLFCSCLLSIFSPANNSDRVVVTFSCDNASTWL